MNPSDKYEQIKDIKHLNPVELEAMVLKHEQQINDIAAHLLELKSLVTPTVKNSLKVQWVGLTDDEIWTLHDSYPNPVEFARGIEAKLLEKNGG